MGKEGPEARKKAEAARSGVEETVRLLKRGTLALPEGAEYDVGKRFIFIGGKEVDPLAIATPKVPLSLDGLFERYRESTPSDEESTA